MKNKNQLKAYVWGFFLGNGDCNIRVINRGKKYVKGEHILQKGIEYIWRLDHNDEHTLKKMRAIFRNIEHCNFKILDRLKSHGVYSLVPSKGNVIYCADKYTALFYDKDRRKIIPTFILNSRKEIKKAFLEGFYLAEGFKNGPFGILQFIVKEQVTALQFVYILKSMDYKGKVGKTKENFDKIKGNFIITAVTSP